MILLDTDHATFLKYPESERGRRLIERLQSLPPSEVVGVAIVTVEERMRGWLSSPRKKRQFVRSLAIESWPAYLSFIRSLRSYCSTKQLLDSSMICAGNASASAPWI